MGEKDETKKEGEKKATAEGGEKKAAAAAGVGTKDEVSTTVVLKLDLHCEGCAKKVRRSVSHLEGVEKVKADCNAMKLTVTGNVDPAWLRERVESKTKKKVELISPQPKNDGGAGGAAAAGDERKAEEKPEKKTEESKADDKKKPKEAAVSTVVMKTKLHCDGCAQKIQRIILKNVDGVESVTTDLDKDLITVNGTMDVKGLITYSREKLKRGVDIVPPKKDEAGGEKKGSQGDGGDKKEKGSGGGGGSHGAGGEEKKEKENGGGEKKEGGGDKKEVESKPEGGGGGGEGSKKAEETSKVEVSKMEYHSHNPQTYYAMPITMYNQNYSNHDYGDSMYHHHHHHQGYLDTANYVVQYRQGPPPPPPTYLNMDDQMFSDENPNGCFVM